jgi:deazaflavin-dependent oxidoreductase (nitroreductase family)
MVDNNIEQALHHDRLIDITTIGRKTGNAHRIEITFHYFDDSLYIAGSPGKRDWYANLVANPKFTFHLKQSMQADIPATATPITDEPTRRMVMTKVVAKWGKQAEIEAFVENSPLVEIQLTETSESR